MVAEAGSINSDFLIIGAIVGFGQSVNRSMIESVA